MEYDICGVDRLHDIKEDAGSEPDAPVETEEIMDEFTIKAQSLADKLNELDAIVTDMQSYIARGDAVDSTKEIKICIEKYSKILRSCKPKIDELEKMVDALKGDQQRPLEFQKRSHLFQNLARYLSNIMQRFDHMKESVSKLNHDKLKRTLEINGIPTTDQEVDEMIDTNDYSILDSQAEISKKKETLQALEERHSVLLQLEVAIKDLNELFCELKLRIMENQEDLDRIEVNYSQAHEYIGAATTQLEKAISYKRDSSKKKLYIAIAVIVIVIIIVIIISVSVARK